MQPEEFKAARYKLNLSVTELADALRLSPTTGATTVREWERGKRPVSGPAAVAIELMIAERRQQDAFEAFRAGVDQAAENGSGPATSEAIFLDEIEDLLWPDNEIEAAASRGNGDLVNV